jgi:hypothetical protein
VRLTTESSRHPKLDYLKDCIMLLGDISSLYPTEIMQHVSTAMISDRVSTLVKFNKDGHLSQTIAYVKQQFRVL